MRDVVEYILIHVNCGISIQAFLKKQERASKKIDGEAMDDLPHRTVLADGMSSAATIGVKIQSASGTSPDINPISEVIGNLAETTLVEFPTKSLLHDDELKHVKSYCCELCPKQLSSKGNLIRHMNNVHSTEGRFVCTSCNKGFGTLGSLNEHKQSHNRHRVQCDQCDLTFKHQSTLTRHKLKHMNTFQFQCSECNKGFNHRNAYDAHINGHRGLSPHICPKCGATFRSVSSLCYHKRGCGVVSNTLKCSECQKKFKREKYLREHMLIHTDPKSYQCSTCGKTFNHRTSLKGHKQRKKHE